MAKISEHAENRGGKYRGSIRLHVPKWKRNPKTLEWRIVKQYREFFTKWYWNISDMIERRTTIKESLIRGEN